MEYIKSKNIFLLIRDTLKLINPKPMNHGSRVAYFVAKMLEMKGGYEKYEIADIVILATLHDIGAYKTDDFGDLLRFEYKEYMRHSIYGYLFFKYLSPLDEMAKVLLYHHIDCKQLDNVDYKYKHLAAYINVADKMDLYINVLGDKFDRRLLDRYVGTRFTAEAADLYHRAEEKFGMVTKVKTGEYKKELDELTDYMIFANEEKRKYLEMLTYCVGFRSQSYVVNEITSICVADELGQRIFLDESQEEILYYGSLLHDIGMLALPPDVIEAPRKLTKEEIALLHTHVEKAENVLKKHFMKAEVVDLIAAHHERGDGSGYPRKLTDGQMNKLQKILQVADVVTGLVNDRSYRNARPKEEVVKILKEEAAAGRLNKPLVNIMITFYDEIIDKVKTEADNILKMYNKLTTNFEIVSKQYEQQKVHKIKAEKE